MVDLATTEAYQSIVGLKHGAVLFSSTNKIISVSHNNYGSLSCGYHVPSLHAESECLNQGLYRRSR